MQYAAGADLEAHERRIDKRWKVFELDRIDNAEIHAWLAEVEKEGAA